MEFENPYYETEYDRWRLQLSDTLEPPGLIIKIDDVLKAHFLICDYFYFENMPVAISGPKDKNILISAIMRPLVGLDGKLKWNNPFEQVATLFYGLVKNHPFHDGNKRTALLIALYYLLKIKRWPNVPQKKLEDLTLNTASNSLDTYSNYQQYRKRTANKDDQRVLFIADYFKRSTRDEDNTFFLITYNEFNTILKQYNIELKNPAGNRIDVVLFEEKRKGILGKKVIQERRIAHIGFPGWKKEISQKDIKIVRKAAGLTTDKGYDSQVLFKNANRMPAIISQYHSPLYRLRDK